MPSGSKTTTAPPDLRRLTFLVDRSLGRLLPRVMREAGMDALTFDEHFAQDAKDDEWLPIAGQRGWYVLTKDIEIRHNFPEIDAIMTYKVGCFLLPKGLKAEEMAALVLRVRARIEGICQGRAGPFIYAFSPSGRDARRDTEEFLARWRAEKARRARASADDVSEPPDRSSDESAQPS